MVFSIPANTQIQAIPPKQKEGDNLLFRLVEKFGEQLDLIRTPNKAIGALFRWVEFMPLSYRWLTFFADRRYAIKAVTSTFDLPMFFVKQVKLYETCIRLKNRLVSIRPLNMGKVIKNTKKIFFSFLAATLSGIKLTQLLDKTRVFALNKISRSLSSVLVKSDCLLSLGLYSMKAVDLSWILRSQLKKESLSNKEQKGKYSSQTTKTMMKLGSSSAKALSSSISAATLFLGCYINPLVTVAASTLSIAISIASKIVCHSNLLWKDKSKSVEEAFASLPA